MLLEYMKKTIYFKQIFIAACWLLIAVACDRSPKYQVQKVKRSVIESERADMTIIEEDDFNRHPSRIHYSKHARCRMECRHIDEQEIKTILEQGTLNFKKSELQGEPCRRKYAVEGMTSQGHRLRVIFAPCGNEMTVVTCIDLGVEWTCHCN